jgi:hypothetical protein
MTAMAPLLARILVGIVLLVSFSIDLANTRQGGAVDFRNRITGVRLMEHGIDPYHFIWHAGDPEQFCDLRNNPHLPISKTTVTPALLLLHAPLAALPYRYAQFLWLFAQWSLFLGTTWLWMRRCSTPSMSWAIVLFATAFSYTQAWRWEAERGQSYLLLAFLFACWMTASMDVKRNRSWAIGFLAGALVALRPPYLLLLPFLALHRREQLLGAAAGLLLGFGLPLLIYPHAWSDYFSAMQTNTALYLSGQNNPPKGPQTFPPVIEGTPLPVISHLYPFAYGDCSIVALLKRAGISPSTKLSLVLALLFLAWLAWTRKKPVESLLPGLAAWFFLADLFLPAIRYSYYDLLILNVVFAGIVAAKKLPCAAWPCVLALPMGWAAYYLSPVPFALLFLPAGLFTLGAVLHLKPRA